MGENGARMEMRILHYSYSPKENPFRKHALFFPAQCRLRALFADFLIARWSEKLLALA